MNEIYIFEQFDSINDSKELTSVFSIKCEELDLTPMIIQTMKQEVTDYNSAVQALNMALQSRKMLKMLDEIRKSFSDPYLRMQKDLISIAKPYEEDLKTIEKEMTLKINDWIERNDLSVEEIKAEEGCFKVNSTWDYEIIDETSVPVHFRKVDELALEKAIKSGVRKIEGVRIYEKKEVKLRIKN